MNWYDNQLCEICKAHPVRKHDGQITCDIYMRDDTLDHCRALRRNREARKHKNTQPKSTVF